MTTDQAIQQAMRELGWSEDRIKEGKSKCNQESPDTIVMGARKLRRKEIRPFIEQTKAILSIPPEAVQFLLEAAREDHKRQSTKN